MVGAPLNEVTTHFARFSACALHAFNSVRMLTWDERKEFTYK